MFTTRGLSQDLDVLEPAAPAVEGKTAATVGGEPISATEAERLVVMITRGKKLTPPLVAFARAQVLEELIARRLVLAYAQRIGDAPTEEAIDAAEAKIKAQLKAQRATIADLLKAEGITQAEFRQRLVWNLVWDKYISRYTTPERREAWFEAHRRELDGSELAVSQILLKPAAGASIEAIQKLRKQAETIRQEIVDGKITFAEAAKKYSASPSRDDGGRAGRIGRHGPMDETFSKAAFALKVGEVSPPVVTPFGISLIRCDEVIPGKKQVGDVQKEVDAALARELLDKLGQIERKHTPVKYSADWPHFKPGTHELDN
jgi:peptidyl-prolyl cis-trans isomerase C